MAERIFSTFKAGYPRMNLICFICQENCHETSKWIITTEEISDPTAFCTCPQDPALEERGIFDWALVRLDEDRK